VSYRQTTVSGLPAIALRSAQVEVVAVPALGLRLTNLRRPRGREWLRQVSVPSTDAGWDDSFLAGAADARTGTWVSSIFDHPGGTTLAGSLRGPALPYELHREVTLDRDEPTVRLRYRLRHVSGPRFPWIWSANLLLNVQPGSTLVLPTMAQVRIDAVHGRDDLAPGDTVSWAGGIGGEQERFVFPAEGAWAVKAFGDVGASGRMTLTDPRRGERLELLVRPEEVPQVGVWINCRGWTPPGATPDFELGLAPGIGAPDRLEDALGTWGTAQWLEPGAERQWTVEVGLADEGDR
jgi:hypothetical protein